MHKLMLLFEPAVDMNTFQDNWQKFLALAERIPGLRCETVSRVGQMVYAKPGSTYILVHELLFDSKEALEAAMQSPEGQTAGQFLQAFTSGKVVLLTAEHLEANTSDSKLKHAV